ncbi:MAG TPA: ABC transporter ATP-binding protein [Deltaproteobacteria bacterium]|nr:ABC transporter ATP-binding protein [Deltaproteobacteria bacterium]
MIPLLTIRDLKTYFETRNGTVKAVDGVDLSVNRGDTLGVVGESGCGKTVLALTIIRLIPIPPGKIVSGNIIFNNVDLLQLPEDEMRGMRGNDISMIFQEPMTSLNPVLKIGDQVAEVIQLHRDISKHDALERAVEMLRLVGMPSPQERIRDYPHQMSGGMRQRVMIAMALACNPSLMLADEPTTALDVTIQAQILELINQLKEKVGTSVILITHDLGVVAEACQYAAIMYAGKIVEHSPVAELFSKPLHPYTVGLMESIPKLDAASQEQTRLKVISGVVPNLYNLPRGCSFQERCRYRMDICGEREPPLDKYKGAHLVRCWRYQ